MEGDSFSRKLQKKYFLFLWCHLCLSHYFPVVEMMMIWAVVHALMYAVVHVKSHVIIQHHLQRVLRVLIRVEDHVIIHVLQHVIIPQLLQRALHAVQHVQKVVLGDVGKIVQVIALLHVLRPAQILVKPNHPHIVLTVLLVAHQHVLKHVQIVVKLRPRNPAHIVLMIVLLDVQQTVRIIVRLDVKIVVLGIVQILVCPDVEDVAEIHVVEAAPIYQQVVSALVVHHLVL